MVYWIILGVACLFDMILEPIKDYKLYYYGLHVLPFTRYELISSWERILFKITACGQKIPYLIYRPQLFRIRCYKDDRRSAITIAEKVFITFELLFVYLRFFIGFRIVYFVLAIVWLYNHFETEIVKFSYLTLQVDYIKWIQNTYQYILANGSALLIIIIAILTFYIFYLKGKSTRYQFENIWLEEENERIKDIADAQKKIQKILFEIKPIVYRNSEQCSNCIRQIDCAKKYKTNKETFSLQYRFEDYEEQVNEIINQIKFIEENNGRELFKKYNSDMWFQLFMLRLTDSDTRFKFDGIANGSKKMLEVQLDRFCRMEDINKIRCDMYSRWTGCISVMNGIERYLSYANRRIIKHRKLNRSMVGVESIKEIAKEIKE